MLDSGLPEAAKRNRETFAWLLLGFVGASLFVEFLALFVDRGFVVNAAGGHLSFVSPFHAGALALAVWLVSLGGEATARGRLVVQAALGLVASLLFVGVIAWLGGLTLEFGHSAGVKTMSSLRFLLDGGLLGVAGWFAVMVLQGMPAPVRPPPQQAWGPSSWDQQYGQPQYGQPQYGQPQYGQPQYGHQQYGHQQYGHQQAAPWTQRPTGSSDADQTQEFGAYPEPDPQPSPGLSIFRDAEEPETTSPASDSSTPSEQGSSPGEGPVDEADDRRGWWPQQPS